MSVFGFKSFIILFVLALLCSACGFQSKSENMSGNKQVKTKSLPTGQDAINAVMSQDTRELALILEKNPKLVGTVEENGYTLLHMSVWKDNARLAKIILGNKADVEAKNKYGFTAMHDLVRCDESNDRKEILEMIIMRRGDVNAVTDNGNTPLDIAEIQEKQDFVRVLKHYGAKRIRETIDLPPVPSFAKRDNDIVE